jgi:hypothetical protein
VCSACEHTTCPPREPPRIATSRTPLPSPPSAPQIVALPQPTSSATANGETSIADPHEPLGTRTIGDRNLAELSNSTDRPYKPRAIDRRDPRERSSLKTARTQNDEATNQLDRPDKRADCAVSVNSVPWAEVWIDGQKTSHYTPVVDYKIACGRHRLAFKRPDLHIYQGEDVDLKPGQTFKQRFVLAN